MAGAEVVEGDANAQLAKLGQGGDGPLGVAHGRALGDLQLQQARIETALLERTGHDRAEVGLLKLAGRKVHCHPPSRPRARLPAGLAQHPLPDGHDHSRLFGDADEHGRRHDAVTGTLPAEERLHRRRLARVQPDHRLVMQHQLLALDGVTERSLQGEPLRGTRVHGGRAQAIRVAPGFLGPVHRAVRVFEEELRGIAVVGMNGDPDAGRHVEVVAFDVDGMGHRLEQFLGDACRVLRVVEVRQKDCELVAAHPGDGVPLAQDHPQARRDRAQQLVAKAVTEGVVDDLESVEVEEHEHERRFLPFRMGESDRQAVPEEEPVRQSGQSVVIGLILDLLLGVPPFTDVARDGDDLRDLSLAVEQGPAGRLEPDHRPVPAHGPIAERAAVGVRHDVAESRPVFRMDDVADRRADHLCGLEAEQVADGIRGIDEDAVRCRARDQVRGVLGHQPVTGLALAQCGLRPFPVRDVDDRPFEHVAQEMHALQHPDRSAVLAAQADLHASDAALLPHCSHELLALGRGEVQLPCVDEQELVARGVSEDAGHGLVALEHAPADGVAIDAGQVPLEEETMPALALAQRRVGAPPDQRADENLAGDAQKGQRFVAPVHFTGGGAAAHTADQTILQDHRNEHGAAHTLSLQHAPLVQGLGRHLVDARQHDGLSTFHALEPPWERSGGKLAVALRPQVVPGLTPLVEHPARQGIVVEDDDVGALGADESADVSQCVVNGRVGLPIRGVGQPGGDAGDELLELDAMAKGFLHLAPFVGVQGDGHEIGDRARELLFLLRPRPRVSDMLEADQAGRARQPAKGHDQHGLDAERIEIGLRERARTRVQTRVRRHDDPLPLQSLEEGRMAQRGQLAGRRMDSGCALEELDAVQSLPVRRQQPETDALDGKGLGRLGGNLPQCRGQTACVERRPPRQVDQHVVLPPGGIESMTG